MPRLPVKLRDSAIASVMLSVIGAIIVCLFATPATRERAGDLLGVAKAVIVISLIAVPATYKSGAVPAALVTAFLWLLFGFMIQDGPG